MSSSSSATSSSGTPAWVVACLAALVICNSKTDPCYQRGPAAPNNLSANTINKSLWKRMGRL